MIIDWFTVVAQICNLIILVFVLKLFLFRPIIAGIDRRKKEIEESILSAERLKSDAEHLGEEYLSKEQALAAREKSVIEAARAKADAILKEKTEQMHREIADLKGKHIEKINSDIDKFKGYAAEKFRGVIFELTRAVVRSLSGKTMEEMMLEKFCDHLLWQLPQVESAIKGAAEVRVASAYELSPEEKSRVEEIVGRFVAGAAYSYPLQKEQVAGFTILIDGYEITWNVDDALSDLEKSISLSLNNSDLLRNP